MAKKKNKANLLLKLGWVHKFIPNCWLISNDLWNIQYAAFAPVV